MDKKDPPPYGQLQEISECPSVSKENPGYMLDKYPDKGDIVKPPTAPPLEKQLQQERMPLDDLGTLTDENVREACYDFASENCCYGTRFIRDTQLPEISNECTYHYQLETFGEKRETVDWYAPFTGQFIDGSQNGPPPPVWEITVSIPSLFQDSEFKLKIPRTSYVNECFKCVGHRRMRCERCFGRGGTCWSCSGKELRPGQQCSSCSETSRSRCSKCEGLGQVTCGACDGKGSLEHFKLLIVTWRNHVESFITDTSNFPKALMLQVSGREIFKEENLRVFPINHARDDSVNEASRAMIQKHSTAFPNELIRKQRHTIRVIPLVKATYSWKNKQGELYVYGFEKKVYFSDYPQKYCCCTCC